MLSWMRWLTSWFWNIVNSEGISGGGFLQWFADSWVSLAVFLIIAGAIVDWIIWMIRWRPHWLWLRKRQIIYEDVPVKKRSSHPQQKKKFEPKRAPALHHAPDSSSPAVKNADDYDDPFADAPRFTSPAVPGAAAAADEDEFLDWDITDDPYSDDE